MPCVEGDVEKTQSFTMSGVTVWQHTEIYISFVKWIRIIFELLQFQLMKSCF